MPSLRLDSTASGRWFGDGTTVTVYGMQGEGKPFLERARLCQVGERSARLDGIEHAPSPGDVIGLEYNHCTTAVRVLWVCERAREGQTQIGVQLLAAEPCPWQQDLEAQSSSPSESYEEENL